MTMAPPVSPDAAASAGFAGALGRASAGSSSFDTFVSPSSDRITTLAPSSETILALWSTRPSLSESDAMAAGSAAAMGIDPTHSIRTSPMNAPRLMFPQPTLQDEREARRLDFDSQGPGAGATFLGMHPTLAALGVGAALSLASASHAQEPSCWVYFGTSATDDARRGLYVASLNQATGTLSMALRATDKSNSVFVALSPDHRHLYSLAEVAKEGHRPTEAIETYAIDIQTGFLSNVGERVVDGSEACHISVDPSGRCILTANYDAHYVEVFPVLPDFTAGPRTCLVRHSGSGPDKSRQESAHPHSINADPSGRFAIVADLGLDRVYVYRLDAASATLTPNNPPFARVAPGEGPRHFAFHPDGRHAFVINEMGASITAFTWDGERGVLAPYQTIPILRADYNGSTNTAAEVVVSRDGRFVYGSNRGDNSLVVLKFEGSTGALSFVQRMTDGVRVPRNYAMDPTGRWLVCANLVANNASVYRIDADTGRLALTQTIAVPEPLCVRFVQK